MNVAMMANMYKALKSVSVAAGFVLDIGEGVRIIARVRAFSSTRWRNGSDCVWNGMENSLTRRSRMSTTGSKSAGVGGGAWRQCNSGSRRIRGDALNTSHTRRLRAEDMR